MWRICANGVPSSQRFGLMTPNGAVKHPLRKTEPVSRTARSISDSGSGPASGRSGASANEGGVPVIVAFGMSRYQAHPAAVPGGTGDDVDRKNNTTRDGASHVGSDAEENNPGRIQLARNPCGDRPAARRGRATL